MPIFFGVISRKPYVPWRDRSWPILAHFQKRVPPPGHVVYGQPLRGLPKKFLSVLVSFWELICRRVFGLPKRGTHKTLNKPRRIILVQKMGKETCRKIDSAVFVQNARTFFGKTQSTFLKLLCFNFLILFVVCAKFKFFVSSMKFYCWIHCNTNGPCFFLVHLPVPPQ